MLLAPYNYIITRVSYYTVESMIATSLNKISFLGAEIYFETRTLSSMIFLFVYKKVVFIEQFFMYPISPFGL